MNIALPQEDTSASLSHFYHVSPLLKTPFKIRFKINKYFEIPKHSKYLRINGLAWQVCTGLLAPWMPMCLASGEWSDRQAPLVDSLEYRQLLEDLQESARASSGAVRRR